MFITLGLICHLFSSCHDYIALNKQLTAAIPYKDRVTTPLLIPNLFNDCRINKALLTRDIEIQLQMKNQQKNTLEFLQTNAAIFKTAWEEFSKRFSNARLLTVYEMTNKTLLFAEATVVFPEDPEQLKEVAYNEWTYLDKKMRQECKLFLKSHEKFVDFFRAEFTSADHGELITALKSFSYRYLLIFNMYILAIQHKKELKKMHKPFSFYNCIML